MGSELFHEKIKGTVAYARGSVTFSKLERFFPNRERKRPVPMIFQRNQRESPPSSEEKGRNAPFHILTSGFWILGFFLSYLHSPCSVNAAQ